MGTERMLLVNSTTSQIFLQIDNSTTLSFYIKEFANDTVIQSIDYKVEKVSGRTTTLITDWTSVSITDVSDSIYSFDYTLSGVSTTDNVQLVFKVIDADGIEYFKTINNISVI